MSAFCARQRRYEAVWVVEKERKLNHGLTPSRGPARVDPFPGVNTDEEQMNCLRIGA